MTREMARLCGQALDKVENNLRRDFYLDAEEAVVYGVIDQVMEPAEVRDDVFFVTTYFVLYYILLLKGITHFSCAYIVTIHIVTCISCSRTKRCGIEAAMTE